MTERCAAKVNDDGIVIELIVGEADWAMKNLGGTWIQSERNYDNPDNDNYPTLGDKWDAKKKKFVPTVNVAAQVAADDAARESAVAKLTALGLTDAEIAALRI